MRVKINIQIFAVIFLLIIAKQIEIYAWLMFFALIHELAHMCTGLLLKLRPQTLEIHPFGICIIFKSFENTEISKIIIAIAGPIINFIFAIIFSYINIKNKDMIVNVNLLLAIFNLIPIYPLDGGRILKSILTIYYNKQIAENVLNKTSNVLMIIITILSSFLILIYKNIGLFLIVIYLWMIIAKENRKYILKRRISNLLEKQKNT